LRLLILQSDRGEILSRSSQYFNNRKIIPNEQFQHWKNNWRNGVLRFVERVLTKRNISDLLGGNLLQIQHLPEVKNQLIKISKISDAQAIPEISVQPIDGSGEVTLNEVILPQFCLELRNLNVDIRSGLAQLDSGFLIDSTLAHWQRLLYRGGMAHSVARLSKRLESKSGTWIALPYSPYYFHTLIEDIPLILQAKQIYPDVRVITSNKNPRWTQELLEILQIKYELTNLNAMRFENYIAVTSPRAVSSLSTQSIYSAAQANHQLTNRKLFITRGSNLDRSDEELEQHILAILEPLGFEVINPSKLSVSEQIAIFSEASFIIGLHGGAMANMVWSKPGIQVLEIFNHPYRTHDFFRLSAACKHSYSCINQDSEISNESVAIMIHNHLMSLET